MRDGRRSAFEHRISFLPDLDESGTAMNSMPTRTPKPPYYAVIFVAKLRDCDLSEYFERVEALTKRAWGFGFMGEDAIRLEDGRFIGIQYWPTLDKIAHWRRDFEHGIAIDGGWKLWYEYYELRVARVESARSFYPDGKLSTHAAGDEA